MATVPLSDALRDRQPEAVAAALIRPVQALERLEQLVRIAGVEADAGVTHGQPQCVAIALATDLDAGDIALARELPGVTHQVAQQLLQQALVPPAEQAGLHHDLCSSVGLGLLQLGAHPFGEQAQVDLGRLQFGAGRARQLAERGQQPAHAFCGGADASEVVAVGVVESVGGTDGKQARETLDRAQRRAQVVRNRVGKQL